MNVDVMVSKKIILVLLSRVVPMPLTKYFSMVAVGTDNVELGYRTGLGAQ